LRRIRGKKCCCTAGPCSSVSPPIQTGPAIAGQIPFNLVLPGGAQIACYYVLRKKKTNLSKNLQIDENFFEDFLKDMRSSLRINNVGTSVERVRDGDSTEDLIPTRASLLSRLKDWNDQESWRAFFDTYWKLIYNTAIKTGLTDAEAQDVVQETLICVSKAMPGFKYRANKRSFKGWLLRLTAWRIVDHVRFRNGEIQMIRPFNPDPTRTATVERVADPAGVELEKLWDEEWENNYVEVALSRVKQNVNPKQYQIFDFYVIKKWPLARVKKALGVSRASIYIAKHRINGMLKDEIAKLQSKLK
jgi:RNA polymerase sigma-70 factor (ECF subfamily)